MYPQISISTAREEYKGHEITFMRIARYFAWCVVIEGKSYGDWISLEAKGEQATEEEVKDAAGLLLTHAKDTVDSLLINK